MILSQQGYALFRSIWRKIEINVSLPKTAGYCLPLLATLPEMAVGLIESQIEGGGYGQNSFDYGRLHRDRQSGRPVVPAERLECHRDHAVARESRRFS